MPKRSGYATALGVDARPEPATGRSTEQRSVAPPDVAEQFYFQLESLLDNWRRRGLGEDGVRCALARAERASFAMELFAKRLQG